MAMQMTTIEVDQNTAAILQTLKAQAEEQGTTLDGLLETLIAEKDEPTNGEQPLRNERMLAALARSEERLKRMPFSGSTEDSLKILHQGRAGEMYGYEPAE